MIEYAKRIGKKVLSAIALGLTIIGGYFLLVRPDGSVVFCDPQGECVEFTQQEYLAERGRLIGKARLNQPLEYEEYQLLVKIYDHEIKQKGGLQITNFNLSDNKGLTNIERLNQALGL